MSVKAIAREVGVAVSSVSVWVRDVPTPPRPPAPPKARSFGRPLTPAAPPDPDEPRKVCGKCAQDLPVSAFNRAGDGRQHWCRECFRAYFRARGDHHRDQSKQSRGRRRAASREIVRARLGEGGCVDCGETEILVLEFDHVREGKTKDLARLLATGARPEAVTAEIERCDVVCVNCHRRRTAQRAGHFRATGVPRPSWQAWQRRNHEHVRDVLAARGCIDCGEDDVRVLDFDHRGEKTANVSQLLLRCKIERIDQEIALCDVRCANCHRLRTLAGGCWREADHWAAALHLEAGSDDPNPQKPDQRYAPGEA